MKSPWIPIFYSKEENKNYFYNYDEKQFVAGHYSTQNNFVTLLSGTVGVILYAIFGTIIIKTAVEYLVILSILLGIITSLALIAVIDFFSRKSIFEEVKVDTKMSFYFKEGEKQFKKNLRMSFWTLLLALGSTFILYFSDGEAILFFATSLFWTIPIPLFVLQRPFKRKKMYALYKKQQLPIEKGVKS